MAGFRGVRSGELVNFFPYCIERADLPTAVPQDLQNEFREAENDMGHGAWRSASAMFRSVLEKTLGANGYTKGRLIEKIDEAKSDGVLSPARAKRAHENIRVLGNDVLHEPWRKVKEDEVIESQKYAQRILEDFYDDRATVEAQLKAAKRIPSAAS